MAFKTAQNQGKSMTNEMKKGWRPMKILGTIVALLIVAMVIGVFTYTSQRSEANTKRINALEISNGRILERLDGISDKMDWQYESLKTLIQQHNNLESRAR